MKAATSPAERTRSSASASLYGHTLQHLVPALVRGPGQVERRLHGDHDFVMVAVVTALHFHDLVPAGDTARHPDGVHGRLRAGVREPPHGQAVPLCQELGDFRVGFARGDEESSVVQLALDCCTHDRVHVTGEQRAETHVVIDVTVAVDILHPGGLSPAHHDRVRVVGLEAGRHPEGQHFASTSVGPLRARSPRRVGRQLSLCDVFGPVSQS